MKIIKKTLICMSAFFATISIPILIDKMIFGNNILSNISNEAWAGFLGSYIGGLCTLVALIATIRYYRDSDKKKKMAAVQPFLNVSAGPINIYLTKGFSLPGDTQKESIDLEKVIITIKNIGNGFATTLVVNTGANFGGLAFKKVIPVGESVYTFFMVDPEKLEDGL